MRILIINMTDLKKYPPVINLVETLLACDVVVELVTYDTAGIINRFKNVNSYILDCPTHSEGFESKWLLLKNRWEVRRLIKEKMKKNDILWTTTDKTIREAGKIILKYKHVMQLMELVKNVNYAGLGRLPISMSLRKYAKNAKALVVPEYNRAQILKAWFELDTLPFVLPNKPFSLEYSYQTIPEEILDYVNAIKNDKRVKIVYQGCFAKDRNFDPVIKFISEYHETYALYIIGFDKNNRAHVKLRDEMDKQKGIITIPHIVHPFYIELTKHADIGLLPYAPVKSGNESELNALFCAPNKIYEYAWCKVPMIGPNIPGLKYPFSEYGIGCVYEDDSIKSVKAAVETITSNIDKMRANCEVFYNSVNLVDIMNKIIDSLR